MLKTTMDEQKQSTVLLRNTGIDLCVVIMVGFFLRLYKGFINSLKVLKIFF